MMKRLPALVLVLVFTVALPSEARADVSEATGEPITEYRLPPDKLAKSEADVLSVCVAIKAIPIRNPANKEISPPKISPQARQEFPFDSETGPSTAALCKKL